MLSETNLNNNGNIWTKTTPDGKPLIRGNSYFFVGQWWTYAGDFQNVEQVPNWRCCYTIGNQIKIRRGIPMPNMPTKEKIKRKRADDSRPINTDINDEDNPLLVMTKEALSKKSITRGTFKSLYDNDSDMNNCLRHIETQNTLSWSRFTDISERLGLDYSVTLKDKNGNVISSFDTAAPIPVKPKRKVTKK